MTTRAPTRPLARRGWWGIRARLLAFNTLLVLAPAAGLLFLDSHENELLAAQERSMVEQGRVLAAALSERGALDPRDVERTLAALARGSEARLRVLDASGLVVGDSSLGDPIEAAPAAAPTAPATVRGGWLYQLGSWPFRVFRHLVGSNRRVTETAEAYAQGGPLLGSEVRAALAGRYGAATRVSAGGQRSVTLYSALPIQSGGLTLGAVLVSKSTYRILQAIVRLRLEVLRVSLAAVAGAVLFSLLLSRTIATPLGRLRVQAEALLDGRGRPTGSFSVPGVRRDEIGSLVCALEGLRQRLLQRTRSAEELASEVAHELRNPLASIRNAAELVPLARDVEERESLLGIVSREVARIEELLRGLRELCRIDARSGDDAGSTDVTWLWSAVIEGHLLRGGKPVRLRVLDKAHTAAKVRGSPEAWTQVFENLLDNAVAFQPGDEPVDVVIAGSGGELRLQVLDRGPGIPPEHLERVFDRFFSYRPRGDAAGQRAHSGLGLAVVRSIVEGFGGVVTAANRPGGGACLDVRLRAAARPRPASTDHSPRRAFWALSRKTIHAKANNGNAA